MAAVCRTARHGVSPSNGVSLIVSIKHLSAVAILVIVFLSCMEWRIWQKCKVVPPIPVLKSVTKRPMWQSSYQNASRTYTTVAPDNSKRATPRYNILPKAQVSMDSPKGRPKKPGSKRLPTAYHRIWKANCSEIFSGNETEIKRIAREMNRARSRSATYTVDMPVDRNVRTWSQDCKHFKSVRGYPARPQSDEEEAFPIAYILVVHKKAAQVERLLRAIYQPQNIYCIHPSNGSSDDFKSGVSGLANCFDNVFIASRTETVVYGGFTRLLADINCMKDLTGPQTASYHWKYVINLCGEDFPLKSNLEIVRRLRSYNGHNDITVEVLPDYKQVRIKYRHVERALRLVKTSDLKEPAPHNMTVYCGLAYYMASRQFIEYVLTNQTAKDLLEWSRDTQSPDEVYWATLQGAVGMGIPGGGHWPTPGIGDAVRFIRWEGPSSDPKCRGKNIRIVCVFNTGYLQYLIHKKHIFVNKFDYRYDPVTMQCLEEHIEYMASHPSKMKR